MLKLNNCFFSSLESLELTYKVTRNNIRLPAVGYLLFLTFCESVASLGFSYKYYAEIDVHMVS